VVPDTELLIRRDIRTRWAPIIVLFWIFMASVIGFGLIGSLGILRHWLRSHGLPY
jgi:hypothetical protein